MIDSIRIFFNQMIAPGSQPANARPEHALQLATAALLLETMRMDNTIAEQERQAIATALQKQFGLDAGEIGTLVTLAAEEARQASGYHQFTSLINKSFAIEQKIRIVEYMWAVAFADGHLHAQEQHLIRKIADLLYVPHAQYIAAKQRARTAVGQSGEVA